MFVAITGPIAGAVVGGLMSSGGSGGSQTMDKSPWAAAIPWLQNNLATGQNLQTHYQQNPFNALQQASYGNLFQGNDYINQMTPGLLAQMSQSQGFDRANPRARPQAMQFPAMQAGFQPTAGLLGSGGQSMNTQANPYAQGLLAQPQSAPQAQPHLPPSEIDRAFMY